MRRPPFSQMAAVGAFQEAVGPRFLIPIGARADSDTDTAHAG
jgi:hypothetical protein